MGDFDLASNEISEFLKKSDKLFPIEKAGWIRMVHTNQCDQIAKLFAQQLASHSCETSPG